MLEPTAREPPVVPGAQGAADQRRAAAAGGLTGTDRVRGGLHRDAIHLRPRRVHQLRAHPHRHMRDAAPSQIQAITVRMGTLCELFYQGSHRLVKGSYFNTSYKTAHVFL